MKVFLKVEHYPPAGEVSLSVISQSYVKRFTVLVSRPEKERERNIKNVLTKIKKLELGSEIHCWAVHKLDQMAAEQREWDEFQKGPTDV